MMAPNSEFSDWDAQGWEELATIWDGLAGEGRLTSEPYRGRFREGEIDAQSAGYVFEPWVTEALRLSGIEVIAPYRVFLRDGSKIKEQIDGLAFFESRGFLIESKFTQVDFGPIGRLDLLASQRPPGTMGLIFAARGFTPPAIESIQYLLPMTVLLFGPDELAKALELRDLKRVIRIKLRGAIQFGVASFSESSAQEVE